MADIHSDDLVLVAVLRTRRDLEIARVLGWYRIPLRTAPKTIRVDWMAFYQTAVFGEEKHAVRYVAPVRGYELTTRGDILRDEPDHPAVDEPYYKVQLGPVEPLPRPIPARRWRRIVFFYTTGARLLSASDVKDLTVPPSQEQDRLWRLLRERTTDDGR
jgi:hypothetical protein